MINRKKIVMNVLSSYFFNNIKEEELEKIIKDYSNLDNIKSNDFHVKNYTDLDEKMVKYLLQRNIFTGYNIKNMDQNDKIVNQKLCNILRDKGYFDLNSENGIWYRQHIIKRQDLYALLNMDKLPKKEKLFFLNEIEECILSSKDLTVDLYVYIKKWSDTFLLLNEDLGKCVLERLIDKDMVKMLNKSSLDELYDNTNELLDDKLEINLNFFNALTPQQKNYVSSLNEECEDFFFKYQVLKEKEEILKNTILIKNSPPKQKRL